MKKKKKFRFKNEAEEANGWYRHRAETSKKLHKAAQQGQLKTLSRKKLEHRVRQASRVITIRLPEIDLALARRQAAREGLAYQTYIKSLLHKALRRAG